MPKPAATASTRGIASPSNPSEDLLAHQTELANPLAGRGESGIKSPTRTPELTADAASGTSTGKLQAKVTPHPALFERSAKVEALRASLDDDAVRTEAGAVLATLIERVTNYPVGERGPDAEVVANVSDLMAFAANENSPRRGSVGGCSMAVVAGTGFEPVTFRL